MSERPGHGIGAHRCKQKDPAHNEGPLIADEEALAANWEGALLRYAVIADGGFRL